MEASNQGIKKQNIHKQQIVHTISCNNITKRELLGTRFDTPSLLVVHYCDITTL